MFTRAAEIASKITSHWLISISRSADYWDGTVAAWYWEEGGGARAVDES
jgi:hypothetical protein